MPRGSAPGERRGGKAKGTPNKSTIARQMVEEIIEKRGGELMAPELKKEIGRQIKSMQQAPRGSRKALEMLRELAVLSMTCVAIYQPKPELDEDGKEKQTKEGKPVLKVSDPEKLQNFLTIAVRATSELSSFESPKLKALAVQEVQPPAAIPGEGAKIVGMMGKRGQQEAASAYLRLVRNDPEAA